MPLEFDVPDCHECKWTALPKPLNTIGIHSKLQLQAGKCKHLSDLPVPALLPSFLVSFCTLLPGLHLLSFCIRSYFTRYTSITAGLSVPPLCHSDTTWYHQDKRYVSQHSDALIWLHPNWISSVLWYGKPKCVDFDQGLFSLASAGCVMWGSMSRWSFSGQRMAIDN